MGRKGTVEKLDEAQFHYVMKAILRGDTDREISAEFESEFGEELPKSSLNNWRKRAGNELAERYQLKRFQVREFAEELKKQGIEIAEDKYPTIIQNIEDHLLTAERDLIAENPLKLLMARQEDERIKLKREKLELDKAQLEFDREKQKGSIDRLKISAEFLQDLFDYVDGDTDGIKFLTVHLKPFKEFLKIKYATES